MLLSNYHTLDTNWYTEKYLGIDDTTRIKPDEWETTNNKTGENWIKIMYLYLSPLWIRDVSFDIEEKQSSTIT